MKDNLDEIMEYYKQNPYKWMEEHFGIKLKWYQKILLRIHSTPIMNMRNDKTRKEIEYELEKILKGE